MTKNKILIADDEMIIAQDLKTSLTHFGYEVPAVVSSGKEAIKSAENINPDLVMMDINLKGEVPGIEAAERIQTSFDIPIVFMTAFLDENMMQKAAATRPYGYLVKPFNERELLSTIQNAFFKKKMDNELKESERKYKKLFEQSNDAVFIHTFDGKILDVNNRACKMLDYSREKMLASLVTDFRPDDAKEGAIDYLKLIREKGALRFESKFQRSDKSLIFVEISASIIDQEQGIIQGIVRNITNRKKVEQNQIKLIKDLENANRELKEYAYVTSHDLKAPLRAINTLANWLSIDYADKFDEKGKENLKLLLGRAKRMHHLIDALLEYSKIENIGQKLNKIDLNSFLQRIIKELSIPDKIKISVECDLQEIIFDCSSLKQIFNALLSNSLKFMDKAKAKIIIKCYERKEFWEFSVSDNGPGIDKKYFNKIFQIFQTLQPRDEFESTGIGLALIKKILDIHNGKIWVESEVGKGSTFYFSIPKLSPDGNLRNF